MTTAMKRKTPLDEISSDIWTVVAILRLSHLVRMLAKYASIGQVYSQIKYGELKIYGYMLKLSSKPQMWLFYLDSASPERTAWNFS